MVFLSKAVLDHQKMYNTQNSIRKMYDKNFYASFVFLNESLTLNRIEELEKISLPTAALQEDTNILSFEFGEGFGP